MSIFGKQQYCPSCMAPVKSANAKCKECGFDPSSYPNSARYLGLRTTVNDRYLVGCVLNENSFSVTYMGFDLAEKKKIIIKEYCPFSICARLNNEFEEKTFKVNPGKEEEYKKGLTEFVNHGKSFKELDAKNKFDGISHITNVIEEKGTAYAIFDYIDGVPLKKIVKDPETRLPASEMLQMMKPLISSLIVLHAENIFFANISPYNILISSAEKKAYLIGFGLYGVDGSTDGIGGIAPKSGFTPLEEYPAFKGPIGGWTDIYGLCASIYYGITGITPPDAPDRTVMDELQAPIAILPDISEEKNEVIVQGLNVYERDRFKAVRALYNAMYSDDEEEDMSYNTVEEPAAGTAAVNAEPPAVREEPAAAPAEPEKPKVIKAPSAAPSPSSGYSQVIVKRKSNKDVVEIGENTYPAKSSNLELDGLNLTDDDTASMDAMTEMEYLSMNDNNIGNIEFVGSMKKLISFSAVNNYITDISCLVNLGELRELYLGGNKDLKDVSVIEHLRGIRKLDLSNTGVTDVKPLIYLDHLKYLNLKGLNVTAKQIKMLYAEMPTCNIRYDAKK